MSKQDVQDLKTNAAETLFRIGKCCEIGDGVGKDEAEAVKWYRMAAEQGLPRRSSNLPNATRSASA